MKNNYLEYGKVRLRPLEPEDVELLYEWENNIAIWEVSNTRAPFSKHALSQYIKNSAYDIFTTKQLRLIIETSDKKPVGAIDLFDFDPYHQRAGLGILIHKNEDKGKGYASDALQAICNYGQITLGLHQLYANIASNNQISLKLFKKTGFKETGIQKEWLKTHTGWKDNIIFQKIF